MENHDFQQVNPRFPLFSSELQAVLRANGMPLWDANGSYHPISHDVMWNFPNRWSHFLWLIIVIGTIDWDIETIELLTTIIVIVKH